MTNNNVLEPIIGTTIRLEGKLFNVLEGRGCGKCALTTARCRGLKKYCSGFNGRMILCSASQRVDNKDIVLEEVI